MKKLRKEGIVTTLIFLAEMFERFTFFGIRSVLYVYLFEKYDFSSGVSIMFVHMFISLSYIFTVMGGIVSDAYWGNYKTIVLFSVVYITGLFCMIYASIIKAYLSSIITLSFGMVFVAVGMGGVKPCVSSFGGQQFSTNSDEDINRFYNMFYIAINIGSITGIYLTSYIAQKSCFSYSVCYPATFLLPGLAMSLSLASFLLGSKIYYKKKPEKSTVIQIMSCLCYCFANRKKGVPFLEVGKGEYTENFLKDIEDIFRFLKIFMVFPVFWMLFDQISTSWVTQGKKLNPVLQLFGLSLTIYPQQMQLLNSVFVLCLIPVFSKVLYPLLAKTRSFETMTGKMSLGLFFTGASFLAAAILDMFISIGEDNASPVSIVFQMGQYFLLTIGEIMFSVTGLEFLYEYSPETTKTTMFSLWFLAVSVGNLLVILFNLLNPFSASRRSHGTVLTFVFCAFFGICSSVFLYNAGEKYMEFYKKKNTDILL